MTLRQRASGSAYASVLRIPAARRTLLLGVIIRTPLMAGMVTLTLHVVSHLGMSYSAAGIAAAVVTIASAISGPWRGRLLDRYGLRRTVLPSLFVLTVCWSIAPFVGYWLLLPLVAVAGLFIVPTFSIIRQVMITAVDDERRKTALVLDSIAVELSYMAGPALGVLLATWLGTPFALLICELASVAGGVALWLVNPVLRPAEPDEATAAKVPLRQWLSPTVMLVLAATMATMIVLTGSDVGAIAALRAMGHEPSIGIVLAAWGLGSATGGLIYGAMRRTVSAFTLLGLLGLATMPVALAGGPLAFGVLIFVAGLFCAPTITATIDQLSRAVPTRVRGEAMGWHGSALTGGAALGSPVAGFAIDHAGWPSSFLVVGGFGLLLALLGTVMITVRNRRELGQSARKINIGPGGLPPSATVARNRDCCRCRG
ncbi:MFS transporter [Microlunatus parietis]|uniref:Putative MFS family arabinose efflux permease n=1 Tax=Microlunatus parietis TaxID=682979 RepID=A0A7Y9LBP2_9ACTN|nr:MFS transporter [Microlunatus parietis]NYE71942.1 putative MFS family arabinose efflux permease [Microlunatus parietis]